MSKTETQLATARADLAAAEQRVVDVAGGESAASISATAYAAWRATRADADVEVDRLRSLVATLSTAVETETRNAAAASQAAMEAKANEEAAAAATIINAGLAEIDSIVNSMMAALAQSDLSIAAAQRGRNPLLSRLVGAEARARGGIGMPLKVITEKVVDRWTFEGDDKPIGEQQAADIVVAHDGRHGFIDGESHRAHVVKRKFRETKYLPAAPAAFVEALAETLSVPALRAGDAPIWTQMKYAGPHDVLQQLKSKADLADQPDRRTPVVEYKLIPETADAQKVAAA